MRAAISLSRLSHDIGTSRASARAAAEGSPAMGIETAGALALGAGALGAEAADTGSTFGSLVAGGRSAGAFGSPR